MKQKQLRENQRRIVQLYELGMELNVAHRGEGQNAHTHHVPSIEEVQVTKFVKGPDGGLMPVVSYLKGHIPARKER